MLADLWINPINRYINKFGGLWPKYMQSLETDSAILNMFIDCCRWCSWPTPLSCLMPQRFISSPLNSDTATERTRRKMLQITESSHFPSFTGDDDRGQKEVTFPRAARQAVWVWGGQRVIRHSWNVHWCALSHFVLKSLKGCDVGKGSPFAFFSGSFDDCSHAPELLPVSCCQMAASTLLV